MDERAALAEIEIEKQLRRRRVDAKLAIAAKDLAEVEAERRARMIVARRCVRVVVGQFRKAARIAAVNDARDYVRDHEPR